MKIVFLVLFAFISVSLQAYSKQIVLSTLDTKELADKLLDKVELSPSFRDFRILSKVNGLKTYVRFSGKYYILAVEVIKSKSVLEEALSLIKPNFSGAFVLNSTRLKKAESIESNADKANILYVDATKERKKLLKQKKQVKKVQKKKIVKKKRVVQQQVSAKVTQAEYATAKGFFDSKNYEEAYTHFNKLFSKDLSNPNINFYLGQSAYKRKKYEEALSAYERILIVDAKAYRAKLEMARCYQQLGLVKEAKTTFLEVRKVVPLNVQKNIDIYLTAIEDKRKKHSLSGAVILGFNYDSNIYGVTLDNVLSDKIPDYTLNNVVSSGWAHQEVIAANYAYAKSETIKYKADFVLFNKTIFSYHDMDLILVQVTPAISVTYNKKLIVDYAIFANKIWLSTTPLMSNLGLYPKIKYIYSPKIILSGAFKFQSQKNNAPGQNRDNNTYSLELGVQNIYTKELTLGLKTKFDIVREKESGEILDLNEVAYNLYELTVNASYKYSPKIIVAPKLKIYQKDYIDPSISTLSGAELYKRSDAEYQLWLNATYIYSPKVLLTLEYVYSIHDSNYADNEFNKNTLSANVIIPF